MNPTRQSDQWLQQYGQGQQDHEFHGQNNNPQLLGPPRLSIDTNFNHQGHFYVPRPSVSSPIPAEWYHPDHFKYGPTTQGLAPQPCGSTASQTLQFQDEMAETMLSSNALEMPPPPSRRPSDEMYNHYNQMKIAIPYDDRRDLKPTLGFGEVVPVDNQTWTQQPMWEQSNVQVKESRPMPIRNAPTFRPIYALGSFDSHGPPSDSTSPMTPSSIERLSINVGGTFESHPWINSVPQLQPQTYNHAFLGRNELPGHEVPEWTNCERSDSIGDAVQMQYPQPQIMAYSQPYSQQYPAILPSDRRSEERLDTPELEGYASSVDTRGSSWQPRGRRGSNDRPSKDEILVDCRNRGMSYKDIKRAYSFTEAESTLRGRYRTLTKDKKDRVRKPEWTSHDLRLLRDAVKGFAGSSKFTALRTTEDVDQLSVPWKEVSSYIARHDGTYSFGYATCKKKFVELLEKGQLNESRKKASLQALRQGASG